MSVQDRLYLSCSSREVVIGTEIGLIERLRREDCRATPLRCVVCNEMKVNSLKDILRVLIHEDNVVEIPKDVAKKARRSIKRMIELGR